MNIPRKDIRITSQWSDVVNGPEHGLQPGRVILGKHGKGYAGPSEKYFTILEYKLEDKQGTAHCWGHYDLTWRDALDDFTMRVRQIFHTIRY